MESVATIQDIRTEHCITSASPCLGTILMIVRVVPLHDPIGFQSQRSEIADNTHFIQVTYRKPGITWLRLCT
jgi:hypothetical protein